MSPGIIWVQTLESNNGDWAIACGNICFPVFDIDVISANFAAILARRIRATPPSPSS
jgi:hypothetical protein